MEVSVLLGTNTMVGRVVPMSLKKSVGYGSRMDFFVEMSACFKKS